MHSIPDVFGTRKVLLPVIHVADEAQALTNASTARDNGAHGVWLIGHGMGHHRLLDIYRTVRTAHRRLWIGLNFLDVRGADAMRVLPADADGIWVDDARVTGGGNEDAARALSAGHRNHARNALYCGGVDFKHQRQVDDLHAAARTAAELMDVVTTSGRATGHEADVDKLRVMAGAVGGQRGVMGLASGVTPENVRRYLPWVDVFFVASGISSDFHTLDPRRTHELASAIRDWN